ncbi:hypothetical protein DPX16_7402 [Anabarilius grahami]|uniref:Uncharacterized protein n=1 Tax=Anabarilius grahami TaxID=495550 RepID=A0A3N0Z2A6_ANAGA|nr:hypothetical protein DPX16_7402 [Anabarilius grahami]
MSEVRRSYTSEADQLSGGTTQRRAMAVDILSISEPLSWTQRVEPSRSVFTGGLLADREAERSRITPLPFRNVTAAGKASPAGNMTTALKLRANRTKVVRRATHVGEVKALDGNNEHTHMEEHCRGC